MATNSNALPQLTPAEYKESYSLYLKRYHGRENTQACISKCLSEVAFSEQDGLRVLLIGPGSGTDELKLLSSYKIAHLIAVEPSPEMADEFEANIRSSSAFITAWDVHRTTVESFLM